MLWHGVFAFTTEDNKQEMYENGKQKIYKVRGETSNADKNQTDL